MSMETLHKHHIVPIYKCIELGLTTSYKINSKEFYFKENMVEVPREQHALIHWGYKCKDLKPLLEVCNPPQWVIDMIPLGDNRDVGAATIIALGEIEQIDTSGENSPMYKHGLSVGRYSSDPEIVAQFKENMKQYKKQYYEDNKEKIVESNKQYKKDNKEKIAEYDKQYNKNNKEKRAEYNKQYNKDNKEKKAEYNKQYNKNNKENRAEYNKQYQKQYRKNNKEKRAEYQKQYCENNKEKKAEYDRQRRGELKMKQRYKETC